MSLPMRNLMSTGGEGIPGYPSPGSDPRGLYATTLLWLRKPNVLKSQGIILWLFADKLPSPRGLPDTVRP